MGTRQPRTDKCADRIARAMSYPSGPQSQLAEDVVRIAITISLALALPLAGQRERGDPQAVWTRLAREHDKNGDGTITAAEYGRGDEPFKNLDRNGDGKITSSDFQVAARRPGDPGTPRPAETALKPGDPAPDFELPLLIDPKAAEAQGADGKAAAPRKEATVKLSSFTGKRPVALIFGSYT